MPLDDMRGRYSTIYLRAAFGLDPRLADYSVSVQANDGFVAYLNGVELGRSRAGAGGQAVRHGDTASLPAPEPLDRRTLLFPPALLRPERNVLALIGLNDHLTSPDFAIRGILRARWSGIPPDRAADAFLELDAGSAEDAELPMLQAYLRARRLQLGGEQRAALEALEALSARDGAAPGPHLHAAECLRDLGDLEGARARLRRALGEGSQVERRRRELWDLWWGLTAIGSPSVEADPASWARVLSEIPAARPSERFAADLRESLEQLSQHGVLRLNCGGETVAGAGGAAWLRDRFFTCGFPFDGGGEPYGAPEPFCEEIAGTEDDALYQTERWFSPDFEAHLAAEGYRIPLPPGDYRVTLHFAEILYRRPQRRLFEVDLEGRTAISPLDIFAEVGFARPLLREVELEVRDGFLDIQFLRSRGEPKVSAIEIRRAR
jgi:hypothetical protein